MNRVSVPGTTKYYLIGWYSYSNDECDNDECSFIGFDENGEAFWTDDWEDCYVTDSYDEIKQRKNEAKEHLLDITQIAMYKFGEVHSLVSDEYV